MTVRTAAAYDLVHIRPLRRLLVSRWPQFLLRALAMAGFLLAILAGLLGTPVGNRNFAIVFVWIAWWALLMLAAVPLLGRGWCSICPIPLPGEWLQQGAIMGPGGRRPDRDRRYRSWKGQRRRLGQLRWPAQQSWPRRFRNIWLQSGAFLVLALFSAVVPTQPAVTAVVLLALLALATGVSLLFRRRAFCRYLCPAGGFIGLYAQAAPLEVRVRNTAVCAGHKEKTCYSGSQDGYGCPWDVFPGGLAKNTTCGVCLECLRTCPLDNIAINVRPLGADLVQPGGRRLDEAYKTFIMLGSALAYSAVMLGPWGGLKRAAYEVGTLAWAGYALGFLTLVVLLLPGLFWLATAAGQVLSGDGRRPRQTFVALVYALVPLGLAAWIAFSLAFVLANGSYIWPVLSDPLGWGWDLLGTAGVGWRPYLSRLTPLLQTTVLIGGLGWSSSTAWRIAREGRSRRTALLQVAPVSLFCLLVTVGVLWLLVG